MEFEEQIVCKISHVCWGKSPWKEIKCSGEHSRIILGRGRDSELQSICNLSVPKANNKFKWKLDSAAIYCCNLNYRLLHRVNFVLPKISSHLTWAFVFYLVLRSFRPSSCRHFVLEMLAFLSPIRIYNLFSIHSRLPCQRVFLESVQLLVTEIIITRAIHQWWRAVEQALLLYLGLRSLPKYSPFVRIRSAYSYLLLARVMLMNPSGSDLSVSTSTPGFTSKLRQFRAAGRRGSIITVDLLTIPFHLIAASANCIPLNWFTIMDDLQRFTKI